MQLGKTCLLPSQSQWWMTVPDWIRHVGNHFLVLQVCNHHHACKNNLLDIIKRECFHAWKMHKMRIKLLSHWDDPGLASRRDIFTQNMCVTFLHLRCDFRESPLPLKQNKIIPFLNQEQHLYSSLLTGLWLMSSNLFQSSSPNVFSTSYFMHFLHAHCLLKSVFFSYTVNTKLCHQTFWVAKFMLYIGV